MIHVTTTHELLPGAVSVSGGTDTHLPGGGGAPRVRSSALLEARERGWMRRAPADRIERSVY